MSETNKLPRAYLARRLAQDLRKVGSFMPLPETLHGNSFTLRLTKTQADLFRKTVDRGAFVCEQYADMAAKEDGEALGPMQTDDEKAERSSRAGPGRPKRNAPAEAGAL